MIYALGVEECLAIGAMFAWHDVVGHVIEILNQNYCYKDLLLKFA